MTKSYFITGTDTGTGKTVIAAGLLKAFQNKGKRVAGFKPVSAGCKATSEGLRNDDAVKLQQLSTQSLPYSIVNPYAYEAPVAPHLAAKQQNETMRIEKILECFNQVKQNADIVVIEGAGGWLVPLNQTQSMADVAASLAADIILVVGIRLGCINHALLTVNSILSMGLEVSGWIANCVEENMSFQQENIAYLSDAVKSPLLATVDFTVDINAENCQPAVFDRIVEKLLG